MNIENKRCMKSGQIHYKLFNKRLMELFTYLQKEQTVLNPESSKHILSKSTNNSDFKSYQK